MKGYLQWLSDGHAQMLNNFQNAAQIAEDLHRQYNEQSQALTVAEATRVMKDLNPAYTAPANTEQRARLSQNVSNQLIGYVQGLLQSAETDIFRKDQGARMLNDYLTEKSSNVLFPEIYAPTQADRYEGQNMSQEQIDAVINVHKRNVGKVWMDALNQILDEHEAFFRGDFPEDDSSFAEEYLQHMKASQLLQAGLQRLPEILQSGAVDYSTEQIRQCLDRINAIKANIQKADERISVIADPCYAIIDYAKLDRAPLSKLNHLHIKDSKAAIGDATQSRTSDDLAELTGRSALNSPDFEKVSNALQGVIDQARISRGQQRELAKLSICSALNKETMEEVSAAYKFVDRSGREIPADRLVDELAKEDPLYAIPLEGNTSVVPLGSRPGGNVGYIAKGSELSRDHMQYPLPAVEKTSLLEDLINWLSEVFLGDRSDRRKRYDNEVAARENVAEKNRRRQDAADNKLPQAVKDAMAVVYRPLNHAAAEKEKENIAYLLQNCRMEPNNVAAYKLVAMAMSCLATEWPLGEHRSLVTLLKPDRSEFARRLNASLPDGEDGLIFRELVDEELLTNEEWKNNLQSGDPEKIYQTLRALTAVAEEQGYFPPDSNEPRKPSKEYVDQYNRESAQQKADMGILPGRFRSGVTSKQQAAFLREDPGWRSIRSVYGANREMRLDWSTVGYGAFLTNEIKSMQQIVYPLNDMQPDGKPMDNDTFAAISMMLAIRPELRGLLTRNGTKLSPSTLPFEDVIQENHDYEPRPSSGNMLNVVELCRGLTAQCTLSMDKPIPGSSENLTGREMLARELAKSLLAYKDRLRGYTWRNLVPVYLSEIAGKTMDFAEAHDMRDLLRKEGVTDEVWETLEINRAMGKIAREGWQVGEELFQSAETGQPEMDGQAKRDALRKMGRLKMMQAEVLRIHGITGVIPEDQMPALPEDMRDRDAMREYNLKVSELQTEANDKVHGFSDLLKDIPEGGTLLDQKTEEFFPESGYQALLDQGPQAVYDTLSYFSPSEKTAWSEALTAQQKAQEAQQKAQEAQQARQNEQPAIEEPAKVEDPKVEEKPQPTTLEQARAGRQRMEEKAQAEQQKQIAEFKDRITDLTGTDKAFGNIFCDAVLSVMDNGTQEQKDILVRFDDDMLKTLSGIFDREADKDLGGILNRVNKAMADEGPTAQQGNPAAQHNNNAPKMQQGGLGGYNG